jgi:hypothetical protein
VDSSKPLDDPVLVVKDPNSTSGLTHLPSTGHYANDGERTKVLQLCAHCRGPGRPMVVWARNGYIAFGGRNLRFDPATRIISGECRRCDKVYRWQS